MTQYEAKAKGQEQACRHQKVQLLLSLAIQYKSFPMGFLNILRSANHKNTSILPFLITNSLSYLEMIEFLNVYSSHKLLPMFDIFPAELQQDLHLDQD